MRLIAIAIFTITFILVFPVVGQAEPQVSARNAVLIEQSTGRVLFEKQAYSKESIASITKIMTAIIAIESGKMEEKAKTSRNAIYTEGSSIYLEQGEKMTIKDLVYGLMLRSGNDSAVAISEHIGGSEEGFVYLMNEKARWLGMNDTNFANPHGLDEENHYSSAYDMAILTQYAMKNPTFREVTGAKSYKAENRTYSWQNKNKLLTQYYEYSTGGKTGFTKKTGRTLVSTATKNDMDLIAVTLNAPDDWRDHIAMFEWGFKNYRLETLSEEKKIAYQLGNEEKIQFGYLDKDVIYPLTNQEKNKVSNQLFILNNAMNKQTIGRNVFYLNGTQIAEATVLSKQPKHTATNSMVKEFWEIFRRVSGGDDLW
ncbi:D-alanyl-D-alanine carboxypeptidase family protein [Virgibacillus proomii]|jgi:serine-type D-Ala-D-Ala carboxypeptidase (penicillin-binding protein 5/6)|uniref:D-alanyl-D-alanine carboxypeptidase family protein n=1 Tax=Virgibacillus proomii TaxID=84407 RepID=UPI000987D15E|nr:D-alanyl-D-alanine carboxypeptidase family protein [Virgibacillus proomii]